MINKIMKINNSKKNKKIQVGIVMGSDSDLPIIQEAGKILDQFNISYELTIVSAHRTPKRLYEYSQNAIKKGLKVIIAGAGGAAHLPGMIAAITALPVIGVPVESKSLKGQDSLLSIVQMPPAIPVATVGIDASYNAGMLAVQILAIKYPELKTKLLTFRQDLKTKLINEKNIEI